MIRESLLQDLSLWGCLWQSTMFIALGLSAVYLLRHRPSRAYRVLLLAMIGATVVPLMSAVVKHFNLGAFTARAPESPAVMQLEESFLGPVKQSDDIPDLVVPTAAPLAPSDSSITEMIAPKYSIPWRIVAVYGWMIATLTLLARLVATFMYGAHIVRHGQRSGYEQIQQAVNKVTLKLGLPCGLQVRGGRRVRSPIVWCWSLPPILLIPNTCMDPKIDWAGVVAHELAHRKRWDHITGLVAELTACLLPWNPLMWLSKKYLIRLGEQACDDWVVAAGQPSEDYVESLLRFRPQRQMAFLPAVVHSKKGLAGRVDRILKDKCGNPRTGVVWALAVSFVAICVSVGVAVAQTGSVEPEAAADHQDRPTESLHRAAADGDIEQVKLLISKGADVNEKDSGGKTPLHYASEKGHTEVARLLISRGAYVNAVSSDRRMSSDWRKPLHYAAMGGHTQTVELLISNGADINAPRQGGRQPWFEAMRSSAAGSKEVVELLVARGAEIPAFHLAAYLGDIEKLKKLLEEGVNVNAPAMYDTTALHAAANGGNKDVVEFLISKGAKVDAIDTIGLPPLYYAALHNYEDITDLLLDKGADVNVKYYDYTLLYHAIFHDGDKGKDAIKLLISKGANVNVKDIGGFTPLNYAIWLDHGDIVEQLINNGADVNAEDTRGLTPYYWAVMQGRKDFVELLATKGATPVSTIHLVARAGDLEKVKAFIEEGTDVNAKDKSGETPLFSAVLADDNDVAKFLIDKGADVSAKDNSGDTPLHAVMSRGENDVVDLLIAKGADVNAKSRNGETPLHDAAYFDRSEIAELLIAKGASVDVKSTRRSTNGMTPLCLACYKGHKNVAEVLIAKGADVNIKDGNGQTPLHRSCLCGHKDVVELLIAKGADMNTKDNDGRTALLLAKGQGHDEIVNLLLKHGAKE